MSTAVLIVSLVALFVVLVLGIAVIQAVSDVKVARQNPGTDPRADRAAVREARRKVKGS